MLQISFSMTDIFSRLKFCNLMTFIIYRLHRYIMNVIDGEDDDDNKAKWDQDINRDVFNVRSYFHSIYHEKNNYLNHHILSAKSDKFLKVL